MRRLLKWSLPILILIEIALVRSGWLSIGQAIAVVVIVEGLLTLVAAGQAIHAVRQYRSRRGEGMSGIDAFADALAVLLPHGLARLVALEVRMWACLGQWLLRRYRPTDRDFSYRKRSMLGAVLLTAPVEIFVIELLIPWSWLRWVLLVLAIYAAIWLVGLYASMVVLPHRLEADGLRLHFGFLSEAFIPYEVIGTIQVAQKRAPGGKDGL